MEEKNFWQSKRAEPGDSTLRRVTLVLSAHFFLPTLFFLFFLPFLRAEEDSPLGLSQAVAEAECRVALAKAARNFFFALPSRPKARLGPPGHSLLSSVQLNSFSTVTEATFARTDKGRANRCVTDRETDGQSANLWTTEKHTPPHRSKHRRRREKNWQSGRHCDILSGRE